MSVRAKFRCETVETSPNIQPPDDALKVVKLRAVYSGSEENEKFFHLTPSGEISLATVNAAAAAQFEAGKEYYVDFTPAG